ncbi:MAG: hypothetical protein CSA86_03655 [Arcobacter sp.]|nr:MAG: hypothetical protein CSA86_03655 [Arcobacter sp.]
MKYKEIILFCLISAVSFVLMAEVVKTVSPVTSTFISYGFAAIIFICINISKILSILKKSLQYPVIFWNINFTTLLNTLLAFVVMTYESALIYAIIFFGTLPFFTQIVSKKFNIKYNKNILLFFSSIILGFLVSKVSFLDSLIGIILTMISSFFAAIYLYQSEILHKKTHFTSSELLSIRFFLVIIFCGFYTFSYDNIHQLTFEEWEILFYISLSSTVLPLFLLQRSVKNIGSHETSSFLPIIPLLAMLIIPFFNTISFSIFEYVLLFCFSVFFLLYKGQTPFRE